MNLVTIVNAAGSPRRVVSLADVEQANAQCRSGETAVVGVTPDGTSAWRWDFGAQQWVSNPPPPPTLDEIKRDSIESIKTECLTRASAIYEGIDSFGTLELFIGLWTQGLTAGAKAPQGNWATLLQTVNAARTAIQAVKEATTPEQVAAVVVAWP
jgi:hypothetical protein